MKLIDIYNSRLEYSTKYKDKFNRSISKLVHYGNILDPVVSKFLIAKGFKPRYPDNKKFAVCISHDVDLLYKSKSKRELLKSMIRLDEKSFMNELSRFYRREFDKDLDLLKTLNIDNKYGINSSYFFLSVNINQTDYNYSLDEVSKLFGILTKSNCEIGLHGSQIAYNSISDLEVEINEIKNYYPMINGYRNHLLKFEVPTTWNILEKSGLKYDTTFGFPDCPGFRNGMCTPFQPFDVINNRFINIYELPLILMDVTLFNYLRLDYKTAFDLFKNLVRTVKENSGVFTFLWHNNFMTGNMGDFYEKCLEFLTNEDAYFSTSDGIIKWFEKNDFFAQQNKIIKELL